MKYFKILKIMTIKIFNKKLMYKIKIIILNMDSSSSNAVKIIMFYTLKINKKINKIFNITIILICNNNNLILNKINSTTLKIFKINNKIVKSNKIMNITIKIKIIFQILIKIS